MGIAKGVISIEVNGQVWDQKDEEVFGLPITWDTENGDIEAECAQASTAAGQQQWQ